MRPIRSAHNVATYPLDENIKGDKARDHDLQWDALIKSEDDWKLLTNVQPQPEKSTKLCTGISRVMYIETDDCWNEVKIASSEPHKFCKRYVESMMLTDNVDCAKQLRLQFDKRNQLWRPRNSWQRNCNVTLTVLNIIIIAFVQFGYFRFTNLFFFGFTSTLWLAVGP